MSHRSQRLNSRRFSPRALSSRCSSSRALSTSALALTIALMMTCASSLMSSFTLSDSQRGVAYAAPKAQKTIKMLLAAIRYSKDEMALKQFNGPAQGKLIFGDAWDAQSPEEQQRFIKALHAFFTKMAFPKLRDKYFKHIETIVYGEPKAVEGGAVKLRATIVVLHALRKEEIPADFMLRKHNGRWLIEDFWIAPKEGKPSFIENLREKQLLPLFKQKGWSGVIEAMEKRVAQLK